jgi:hypothetical protein
MGGSVQDDPVEQIILGLGQEVFNAIRHKDVGALGRILSDDFTHRAADGSETGRDDFLRGIGDMPVEVTSVRGEHLRVSVYGEVAVMTGVQRAEWRQGDEAEGVSSVAFVDVFALRGGRWLMVLAYGADLQG